MSKRVFFFATVFLVFLLAPLSSYGDRAGELRENINERQRAILELEKEIREYEGKILETKKESQTLSNLIRELDTTRKKLSADIAVTGEKVSITNLEIEELGIAIDEKIHAIEESKTVISKTFQELREAEKDSFVEVLFRYDSFSEFWSALASLEVLQGKVTENLLLIRENKEILEMSRKKEEERRSALVALKVNLGNQKKVADIARTEKDTLLAQTKNRESNYARLVSEKKKRKQAFEEELASFEAALKEALDPASVPHGGSGILSWPLLRFTISQYFGDTPFATLNPQIYSGKGHNGIDLAAPIGTAVYPARPGSISGTGDTDLVCPNASYGKWILITHDNGLSTLYAHLSLISTQGGAQVGKDAIIGYTGNTGYSTGPHLHFTVFATDAVAIGELKSKLCQGKSYTIPLLSKSGGYLNPLSYLPAP